tara:strand:- start:1284 stop:2012 length:729 start_codon:yes stop_codon:yes gene_type:complete
MSSNVNPEDKLILALDGMDKSQVFSLIAKLPRLVWVKVGLELFTNEGPDFLSSLRDQGRKIFLDLKYHDIPVTMAKACFQATKTGAELISVHACAGSKALKLSNNYVLEASSKFNMKTPTLLAITVLTSWDDDSFNEELCIKEKISARVERLASLAFSSGIGGCVCSPLEVNNLRTIYPESFQIITPGIRLKGSSLNDQSRVMTPSEALKSGSSKIVVGRSITKSEDPASSFREILNDCIDI